MCVRVALASRCVSRRFAFALREIRRRPVGVKEDSSVRDNLAADAH